MSLIDKIFPLPPATVTLQAIPFSAKKRGSFFIALLQLAGILLVFSRFNIEKNSGLSVIAPVVIAAFIITHVLSLRFRPAVLFATSLWIIYHAFGFFSGTVLVVGGLGLIACCHLPIKLWMRVALIVIAGLGMVILRANLFYAPRALVIVPYLASMFMFRIIIYLHELKYGMVPATYWQRLSYFFLFPNHCFLLFPIIDFKAYLKTYYARPENELWQKGIRWMLRGIVHLLCYRIIYFHLLIGPADVTDLPTLLEYMVCSYALILRLSGLFHFILGLLCMFGFDLHPIFNNYLLATSFVDMWRRINIYWREFIMKIFFYPLMFKLKKRITANLLPATMILVFVVTWAMHNYQWFWLRGYFPLTAMDILFWGTLGTCITVNTVLVERNFFSNAKPLSTNIAYPLNVLKMLGLFLFMSVMWSLWGSDSISEWKFLLSKSRYYKGSELIIILSVFTGVIVIGTIIQKIVAAPSVKKLIATAPHKTLALTLPSIAILLALTFSAFRTTLPANASGFIASLSDESMNTKDKQANERGYYKALIDGEDNTEKGLWEVNLTRPNKFASLNKIYIRTTGIMPRVFRPSTKVTADNYTLETDSLGLRDKEYARQKPAATFRIALMGGSYEAGAGVNNNEIFEALVEEKLNAHNTDSSTKHFEILNFAEPGYHLLQHVELCKTKIFTVDPDAVIYVAHSGEHWRLQGFMADMIKTGADFQSPFINAIKKSAGVKQTMSDMEIKERLKPFMDDIILWSYMQMVAECRKHHVVAVWAYLPATMDSPNDEEFQQILGYAKKVGFVIMDLRNTYGAVDRKSITLSQADPHPNPKGHRLIAEGFYEELMRNKEKIMGMKK